MVSAYSPRVVGQHQPDYHSIDTLLKSPQFVGKQGESLALALYDFFTSQVDGTYHFWPSDERPGHPRLRREVRDTVKLLNCYGWAICGQSATMMYALYRAAGFEARLFGLPGHALCEVFYDGRWHVLDVDMWTWFRTPQGHIASAFELTQNAHELIVTNTSKSDPCNLPDRSLADYAEMYAKTETVDDHVAQLRPGWQVCGHNMDFRLRPGETLIRTQTRDGRHPFPPSWMDFQSRHNREWIGYPRERFEPFRTYGNGRWIYESDLTDASSDVASGAWACEGVIAGPDGLTGIGHITFRIQSSYPFCGTPLREGDAIETSDGVWLSVAGQGPLTVSVTDPEGAFVPILRSDDAFDTCEDVTSLVASRYETMVRLEVGPGGLVHRLRFEGYILTAPMSLPRLTEGANTLEVRTGDKYGLSTVPWVQAIDFRQGADMTSQFAQADNVTFQCEDGWQRATPTQPDQPAALVARFDAPPDRPFAWAYVFVGIQEGPVDKPPRCMALEWSGDGSTWQPLGEHAISNTDRQWECSQDGEFICDRPARTIWVRVTSETAVTVVELHGHVLDPSQTVSDLRIVHRWIDDTGEQRFEVPAGKKTYTLNCGPNPRDHSIEMAMPSTK